MKKMTLFLIVTLSVLIYSGCGSSDPTTTDANTSTVEDNTSTAITETYSDSDFETTDWSEATHTKNVDPNYDEVFDDTAVKRLDFVVTQARWQSMLDDMEVLLQDKVDLLTDKT